MSRCEKQVTLCAFLSTCHYGISLKAHAAVKIVIPSISSTAEAPLLLLPLPLLQVLHEYGWIRRWLFETVSRPPDIDVQHRVWGHRVHQKQRWPHLRATASGPGMPRGYSETFPCHIQCPMYYWTGWENDFQKNREHKCSLVLPRFGSAGMARFSKSSIGKMRCAQQKIFEKRISSWAKKWFQAMY